MAGESNRLCFLGVKMSDIIISTENLRKAYRIGSQEVLILNDISIEIRAGEFVVISGSSGSGKTTLLSILSGLDRPTSGRVILKGRDITELTEDELAPVRNLMTGFVFQAFHLVPSLNALENVMFPAELKGDPNAEPRALALLKRVGLEHRRYNFPQQLSGGEQQRVAICRALVNSPAVLFADEPTGNLDSENSRGIIDLLLDAHKEQNTTLVMATHSQSIARRADRIIYLRDGEISRYEAGSDE